MYEMFERDELGEILIPIIDNTSIDDEPIELSISFEDDIEEEEDGDARLNRLLYLFDSPPEGEKLVELNRAVAQREIMETTEKLIGGKIIPTLVLNNIRLLAKLKI